MKPYGYRVYLPELSSWKEFTCFTVFMTRTNLIIFLKKNQPVLPGDFVLVLNLKYAFARKSNFYTCISKLIMINYSLRRAIDDLREKHIGD